MNWPRRNPDLTDRTVDGERVLLDREHGRIHRLNSTASFVWDQCDGTTSPETIVQRLAREWKVEPDRVRADVERLLGELENENLVAGSSGPR